MTCHLPPKVSLQKFLVHADSIHKELACIFCHWSLRRMIRREVIFMTKLVKGIVTTGSAAAFVALSALPAFAASTSVDVVNNGALSTNTVGVSNTSSQTTNQTAVTNTGVSIHQAGNTGMNNSSFNTNGSNSISTGPVTQSATVENGGSSNTASNPCGCEQNGTTTVTVDSNGALSHNTVGVSNSNTTTTNQTAVSNLWTHVSQHGNTGKNNSSFNTGGSNTTTTGGVLQGVGVMNTGSSNTLH